MCGGLSKESHIASLVHHVSSAVAIGENCWTVPVNDGHLIVCLPEDFPVSAPVLRVDHVTSHRWIDPHGSLDMCPGIQFWHISTSNLGRLVSAVVRDIRNTHPPSLTLQSPKVFDKPKTLPHVNTSGFKDVTRVLLPARPPEDCWLQKGSKSESFLKANPELLVPWLNSLPHVKCYEHAWVEMIGVNKQLLEDVTMAHKRLEELQHEYSVALTRLEQQKGQFEEIFSRHREWLRQCETSQLKVSLKTEIEEDEKAAAAFTESVMKTKPTDMDKLREEYFDLFLKLNVKRAKLYKLEYG
eukprot:CAMPEP_0113846340 /NCGR_PEP_ID=MMETSP0372-20130328/1255_1 /TAXON_ID=340204 /ORGANISM="Lankesteria abbotti" /LENGTH=297 /DNA_ID=CAMNT_0000815477 /DNA_START=281 /DNA_END=1174 /DNA_ORIENTATION=- /assembly_acc=CAM_ASM_000359